MKLKEQKFAGRLTIKQCHVRLDDLKLSACVDEFFSGKDVIISVRELFPGELEIVRDLLEAESDSEPRVSATGLSE